MDSALLFPCYEYTSVTPYAPNFFILVSLSLVKRVNGTVNDHWVFTVIVEDILGMNVTH